MTEQPESLNPFYGYGEEILYWLEPNHMLRRKSDPITDDADDNRSLEKPLVTRFGDVAIIKAASFPDAPQGQKRQAFSY